MSRAKEIADKYEVDVEDIEFYYEFFVLASEDPSWDSYEKFIVDKLMALLEKSHKDRKKHKKIKRLIFLAEYTIYTLVSVMAAIVIMKWLSIK